ncbi:hypothetical protein AC578_1727 [Pseudocercospora eumusae]|uniref:2-dehydropantoate 2-reductase n=1 Tax=Pseudocercospora eumusae TaxID=321146 RepID=A0A139GZY0_9PEZI|nr:hypothetical protein AC578_1727 [Pseudocercospora eumusae]
MASTSTKPKILLFGSGAIGTIYMYLLLKAGCDVTAVCRSNYTAAKSNGFHIDSEVFGKGIHINPKVVRTVSEASDPTTPYDYLIVSCKAIPSAKTSSTIAPAVTPNHTTIVLIQNGIDIEPEYALAFPHNNILTCIAYLPTTQTSPAHITMGNNERLEIGTHPESSHSETAQILISLLKSSGSNASYHPHIQERRWYKLLLNAPWNPICALTLSRDVAFLSSSFSESIIRGVLDEVILLSQTLGYKSITPDAADSGFKIIKDRVGKSVGIEPSMLVDVLNGRQMEHEVILGNPVRKAKELGVEVPRLEMLYGLTKALDLATQKRKPGRSLDGEDLRGCVSEGF